MTEMTQDQKKAFVVGTLNMPEKLYEDLRNANPNYIDNLVAAKDDLEAMFAGNREVIAGVHDHVNSIIDQTFVAAERAGMGHAECVALTCVSIGGFANQVAEEADRIKGFAAFMAKSAASGLLDVLAKEHARAKATKAAEAEVEAKAKAAEAKADKDAEAEAEAEAEAKAKAAEARAAKYEAKAIEEKLMKAMNADNPVFRVSMFPIL